MDYLVAMDEAAGEYSEKHSRFLGFITPVDSEEKALKVIAEKRKKYWDARHIVYAYILSDGTARFSDDGEPHGTAGKPVLEVLSSSGIKNAIITVARYFGGILLGTGGLVRAYTAAAQNAIANCNVANIAKGNKYSVSIGYGDYDKLVFLLNEFGADIIKPDFSDKVKISFIVREDLSDDCLLKISDVFSSSVVPKFEEKANIFEKNKNFRGN